MECVSVKKGFTLIELLVVITIIGILAVGGAATYTAQIQKARDGSRMSDLNVLRSGIEQFYQDFAEYPDVTLAEFTGTGNRSIAAYVPKLPRDPKSGSTCGRGGASAPAGCDYAYNVSADAGNIAKGRYRVSSGLESQVNVVGKAGKDGGMEDNRLEFGLRLGISGASTSCERSDSLSTPPVSTVIVTNAYCDTSTAPIGAVLIAGN